MRLTFKIKHLNLTDDQKKSLVSFLRNNVELSTEFSAHLAIKALTETIFHTKNINHPRRKSLSLFIGAIYEDIMSIGLKNKGDNARLKIDQYFKESR